MTVAHELAERGYDVHVIEREVDPESPDLPDTGGVARTQWWHPPSATKASASVDASIPWVPRSQVFVLYEEGFNTKFCPASFNIFSDPRALGILTTSLNIVDLGQPVRPRGKDVGAGGRNGRPRFFTAQLQVWHETCDSAHEWWQQNRATVMWGLRKLVEEKVKDYPKAYSNLMAVLGSVDVDIDGYGYDSIELESHDPERIRLVLAINPRDPLVNSAVEPEITARVGPRTALPGEHGYRFFPSFYSNVFDTMRRVPILRSARRESKTPDDDVFDVYRTVFDNLRSVERHSFAFPGREGPVTLDRRRVRSLHAAMKMWRVFQQKLGFSLRDTLLYQVCLLRFLTSGESRRKDTERFTWNAYVGAERFSPAFQEALESWSLALGGLRGSEADARTFGAIALQFLIDQVEERPVVDGTLNGPTSQAWFQPWRRMLARRIMVPGRVTFHAGEVLRLYLHPPAPPEGVAQQVRAVFSNGIAYRDESERSEGMRLVLPESADLVLATPPHETYRLLRAMKMRWRDFDKQRTLDNGLFTLLGGSGASTFHPSDLRTPEPPGPLRHFIGIQFFQDESSAITEGHIYLPKSAWGLTAIGQSQFRATREGGRRGVVSVDVGAASRYCEEGEFKNWKPEAAACVGDGEASPFWKLPRKESVDTVWATMADAVSGGMADLSPDTPIFTVDRGIVWGVKDAEEPSWLARPPNPAIALAHDSKDPQWDVPWIWDQPGRPEPTDVPLYNNTPYLITTAGRFHERPGNIDRKKPLRGYDPVDLNLFIAGSYTQTFTRIVTMESACESGRHVVNGILRRRKEDQERKGEGAKAIPERCKVFNPEDLEPADLLYWKELDERLYAAGLPHLLDILRVEEWLEELLPTEEDDDEDTGDSATLVDRFDRLVDVFEPDGDGVKRLIQWAGAKSFGLLALALRILGR